MGKSVAKQGAFHELANKVLHDTLGVQVGHLPCAAHIDYHTAQMDWSAESDAWCDVFLSLDAGGTSDDMLPALLLDRDSFDGVPDRLSIATIADKDCVTTALDGADVKRSRVSEMSQDDTKAYVLEVAMAMQPVRKKNKRSSTTTKQTIERLRESVHEAECKLALLRSRQQQRSDSPGAHDDGDNGFATCALSVLGWKDVATRQYRWRRESEVANAKLRAACQQQEKIMQGLERLVRRSRAVSRMSMAVVPVDIEGARYAHRIHELMAVTSEMYMQVQLGMLPDASNLGDPGTTRADPYNSVHRLVPCPPQAVLSAVWSYFCRSSGETDSYFQERIDASQDTVVKSFLVRWVNDSAKVNHRGIVVARRLPQPNGLDLIVYTAELEALEPLGEAHHGFRTNAWTIVRPSLDALGHSEVVIKHVTSPIATRLADAASSRSNTPQQNAQHGVKQFVRLAQFSLTRHLERVQRAIDGAFI